MKVAIINITAGGMGGGYRKYLKNIIPLMAKHHEITALLCAAPAQLRIEEWFGHLENVKFVKCSPFKLFRQKDKELEYHLDEFSPDVLFIPLERYFAYKNVPVVNMVQNMLPFVAINNNTLQEKVRNYVQKKVATDALMRSNRVIAISNYVKEYLIGKLNVPNERVGLVYFGVEPVTNNEGICPTAISHNWRNDFLFTAGTIEPYRGLEDIFLAIKKLQTYGRDIKLVIAGDVRNSMLGYKKKLEGFIKKLGLLNQICWVGKLEAQEMSWCYKNCRTFIATSRVEAFPNIVLEAMAQGCLSIAADVPPLPEFFKKSAVYYSLGNVDDLSRRMLEVLDWGNDLRKQLAQQLQLQTASFSWEKTVENTIIELLKTIKNVERICM